MTVFGPIPRIFSIFFIALKPPDLFLKAIILDALFFETHFSRDLAKSDATNLILLDDLEELLIKIEKISKFLSNVVKKTKHIDFLALPFLSFSTLYKNKIIAPKNDIFIFLGNAPKKDKLIQFIEE